ncbi:MAG: ATP-binding protein [Alphaproteobacteria bacterium]|nr:ATP-binding protein [Alphaproteobacteria bacterium]
MITVTPVILIQIIGCAYFFDNHWENISHRLTQGISYELQTALSIYEHCDSKKSCAEAEKLISANSRFEIKFSEPLNVSKSKQKRRSFGRTSDLVNVLENIKIEGINVPYELYKIRKKKLVKVRFLHPKFTAEAFIPYKYFFSSTIYVFVIWSLGSTIILMLIALLFLKNQIKPIIQLANAAENFGLGRDTENFKPAGATEIRQAAVSFIKMKDRLRRHIEERTRMLAGVSHDLRTPLTRMKLQLSMMESNDDSSELLKDVEEMDKMLTAYLDFAKGEGQESTVLSNIPNLISEAIKGLNEPGKAIQFFSNAPLEMSVRPNDFKRIIWNLVKNAIQYGTIVNIALTVKDRTAEIIVEDNGPGIPVDKRNDVFKAFYRIDESRNKQTGGVGLGLAITKDIVLSHGGNIYLTEGSLGGLKAVINFPIDKNIKK